ncbi:MAG: hypothetical protein PHC50_05570 [Candidatus Cloacimonetes bacterium]|nr:hypothetical protein [Candidatus Cloacimonadota bacterium]
MKIAVNLWTKKLRAKGFYQFQIPRAAMIKLSEANPEGEGILRGDTQVCPYISKLKVSGCTVHFAFQEILTQRYQNAVFTYISNATLRAERLSRNAKTKHDICITGNVGAQGTKARF